MIKHKRKISVVFGTRPEAIKMMPLVRELKKYKNYFEVICCATAQHRELLDEVLNIFSVKVDYDLDIMRCGQSLFDVTNRVLRGVGGVLLREKPSLVIVQGDTTTAFAAGLASFYLKIPLAHLEAGLRTYDKYHPFPEEINRRLISQVADIHFVPTFQAKKNLLREGIAKNIYVTGNTVVDALNHILTQIDTKKMEDKFAFLDRRLRTILVTAHRRENFGAPLENICAAIRKIVARNNDIQVVYPVHPNPNVSGMARRLLTRIERVHLIMPLDYVSFVYLMSRVYIILTDSGGIQEEAPSLGKPVLVMRNTTERNEAIKAGVAKLVGTHTDYIVNETEKLLREPAAYAKMLKKKNPFGDGHSAEKIVRILMR